jgi:hypothetical protein
MSTEDLSAKEPSDYLSEPFPEGVDSYDSFPVNDLGSHPKRSKHHWRISIEQVDQETRDARILEDPMEYIIEACAKYPPLAPPRRKNTT